MFEKWEVVMQANLPKEYHRFIADWGVLRIPDHAPITVPLRGTKEGWDECAGYTVKINPAQLGDNFVYRDVITVSTLDTALQIAKAQGALMIKLLTDGPTA